MKILSVASARPNFVKLAAVHHALAGRAGVEHVIVHTGQHFDPLFSDVFFQELAIPVPQVNLGIHGGANDEQQVRVEAEMKKVLETQRPDWVLVYGDVNGAAATARAATAAGLRLAHVEAGLRSGDLSMPEENNRIAIDAIADVLFCTEQSGMDHLQKEGAPGAAHLVGNTMIDTLIRMLPTIEALPRPEAPERFVIGTFHRPSNVDARDALASLFLFLDELASHIPVVLPLHVRTRQRMAEFGLAPSSAAVHVIDPLPYMPFLRLVMDSAFVLTDSGGIQEETTYLRKRCFTARPNTERPITIDLGSNTLVDLTKPVDRTLIIAAAKEANVPVGTIPPLWDGKAGERIVDILLSM